MQIVSCKLSGVPKRFNSFYLFLKLSGLVTVRTASSSEILSQAVLKGVSIMVESFPSEIGDVF